MLLLTHTCIPTDESELHNLKDMYRQELLVAFNALLTHASGREIEESTAAAPATVTAATAATAAMKKQLTETRKPCSGSFIDSLSSEGGERILTLDVFASWGEIKVGTSKEGRKEGRTDKDYF